ncbi:MAG: hypothetical protein HYU66_02755 [Armatimonadetes bacterium]|nr:hypothetical protein [Armatimonadota bacterium]
MVLIAVLTAVLAAVPPDPVDGVISLPTAYAAVRAFEKAPDLGVAFRSLDRAIGPTRYRWPAYNLQRADPQRHHVRWSVDPWTGRVVGWGDDDRNPMGQPRDAAYWAERRRKGSLPLADLQQSALVWLESRIADFSRTAYRYHDYAGSSAKLQDARDWTFFNFAATRHLRGSATPIGHPFDAFRLQVGTGSGDVFEYWEAPPTDTDLEPPVVSQEQAVAAGLAFFHRPDMAFARSPGAVLLAEPTSRFPKPTVLCWHVGVDYVTAAEFKGLGVEHEQFPMGMVQIDAATGQVLEVDDEFGRAPDRHVMTPTAEELATLRASSPPSPIFIRRVELNGVRFLLYPPAIDVAAAPSVAQTFAWQLGVRVYRHDDGRLLRGVREVVLPADQVVTRNNETYYPLGPLATAANATVLWNKETGELRITCPYKGGLLDDMANWD